MKKEEVLAKIEKLKGRPIEIGLADETVMMYSGIEGHWLFSEGDNLIEVKANACDGTYGFDAVRQQMNPFIITVVQFDIVNYVRSYIGKDTDDIATMISGFSPIGIDKTFDEVKREIETSSIRKARSMVGYSTDCHKTSGGPYGSFKGSAITTDINGFPKDFPVKQDNQ